MTRKEHLLIILAEECSEVAHRVSKGLRFSLEEIQLNQELNNGQRIIQEFNDLFAVMEMLVKEEHLPNNNLLNQKAIIEKQEKIEKYLKHSEYNKTLTL